MNSRTLTLSPKYKAFLRCRAELEIIEGTTAAGKTTVGLYKFILKCAASSRKLHLLAAEDTGAAEKNIINNLFDYQYIGKAYNSSTSSAAASADNVYVFYNFGRTYTIRLKLNF